MNELELKITVRAPSDLGTVVQRMITDGEKNDGVVLASEGHILDVAKVERADGLPLTIEDDFAQFVTENIPAYQRSTTSYLDMARKAYFAGRSAT